MTYRWALKIMIPNQLFISFAVILAQGMQKVELCWLQIESYLVWPLVLWSKSSYYYLTSYQQVLRPGLERIAMGEVLWRRRRLFFHILFKNNVKHANVYDNCECYYCHHMAHTSMMNALRCRCSQFLITGATLDAWTRVHTSSSMAAGG